MATADLTVIALGRAEASASTYIAAIQRRLAAQDRVKYVMHAMGTSLEGETADILALVAELHAVPFEQGIPRVYTVLKLDERRDKAQTPASRALSKDLKKRGWRFVGPTTVYAFMQAMGLVDDHVDGCAIRPRAEEDRREFVRP